jgi:PAS domain-containing protein
VVETGIPLEEEFPISGQPGLKASWIHHQVVPVGDGILITSRDITERVERERALQESESRYRALYEAIPRHDFGAQLPTVVIPRLQAFPATFATLTPP